MHKMMLILAALAICLAAPVLKAGWLYDGTLTVAAGATNAVADITLKGGSPVDTFTAPLDFVTVDNASGSGTGTVSWAAVVMGQEYTLASTNGIAPGAKAALWPRRTYAAGSATNAETWLTRTLRVRVTQASTNSTPTVYTLGAGTR